jgi:hypothetical protein
MIIKRSNYFITASEDEILDWDCWEELELSAEEKRIGIKWTDFDDEKGYLISKMIDNNSEYETIILMHEDDYELYLHILDDIIRFELKLRR